MIGVTFAATSGVSDQLGTSLAFVRCELDHLTNPDASCATSEPAQSPDSPLFPYREFGGNREDRASDSDAASDATASSTVPFDHGSNLFLDRTAQLLKRTLSTPESTRTFLLARRVLPGLVTSRSGRATASSRWRAARLSLRRSRRVPIWTSSPVGPIRGRTRRKSLSTSWRVQTRADARGGASHSVLYRTPLAGSPAEPSGVETPDGSPVVAKPAVGVLAAMLISEVDEIDQEIEEWEAWVGPTSLDLPDGTVRFEWSLDDGQDCILLNDASNQRDVCRAPDSDYYVSGVTGEIVAHTGPMGPVSSLLHLRRKQRTSKPIDRGPTGAAGGTCFGA